MAERQLTRLNAIDAEKGFRKLEGKTCWGLKIRKILKNKFSTIQNKIAFYGGCSVGKIRYK
jgi:hypothetical protein